MKRDDSRDFAGIDGKLPNNRGFLSAEIGKRVKLPVTLFIII
jgi:hypothetical protein